MQPRAVFYVVGAFLMLFSFSMLPPIAVAHYYHEQQTAVYWLSFLAAFLSGFLMWFFCRKKRHMLKIRDGFLIVVMFWFVLGLFGAIPLMIGENPHIHFTDAVFESISGLTTTGSTIFATLKHLPRSLLFYRQELQFLGGMGIIVLAVAIIPMLGIGGMQLYRAETPGPMKDSKLRPRITETAKSLWLIYVLITFLCGFCFWLCGMPLFDAVGESFATVSTGGFSMHATSFSFYHSAAIDMVAIVFMILGATNFALHYLGIKKRSLMVYWKDYEFRNYIKLIFFVCLISAVTLIFYKTYDYPNVSILNSVFDTVSLATTTGFTSGNFSQWPTFVPNLLLIVGIIGGCGGSTSGGIKIMRFLMMCKQGAREVKKLIHPNGLFAIKFGKDVVPDNIVNAVWGFLAVFSILFAVLLLLLMVFGLDLQSAFSALASCISNSGATIGELTVKNDFNSLVCKWILIIAMLAGRLEVFTLLVLFMPSFWRR